jgi:hypothetical protein
MYLVLMISLTHTEIAASQRVLELPELLELIMQQLAALDPKKLLPAALVNSLWADVAISVKWQAPSLAALAAVPAPRRHALARKVRALSLSYHDFARYWPWRDGDEHSFAGLRRLDVNVYDQPPDEAALLLRQFLGGRLASLRFRGSSEALIAALTKLGGQQAQLLELHVEPYDVRVDAARVVAALEPLAPHLSAASFWRNNVSRVEQPLLFFFAACPRLR